MNGKPAICLLEPGHDRAGFDCGVEPLNTYLRQYALQNQKRNMVRNYVVALEQEIMGYYSLAYGSVAPDDMPVDMRSGNYRIPIMLIARLAVDTRHQGKGLGHAMVQDASLRSIQAADIAGLKALFVHAKDDKAKAFYQHHGFIESAANPLHLYFPVSAAPGKK